MTTKIGVDPRCVELAHHFLDDVGADNDTLALDLGARVQRAVEDWIDEARSLGD